MIVRTIHFVTCKFVFVDVDSDLLPESMERRIGVLHLVYLPVLALDGLIFKFPERSALFTALP